MGKFKEYINESSLSRLQRHMKDHDSGIITASRFARDCGKGDVYTKEENFKRNKSLLAKLQSKRYSVTSVKGKYIENYDTPEEKEVGENVFFVVDINDTGNLLKDLKKWGFEFEQDSVLYIPKGGTKSELHGTNKCVKGYPGYNNVVKYSKRILGDKGKFFTTVKGRPFVFKEDVPVVEEHQLPQGFFGRMGCDAISKKNWQDIELD